MVTLKKRLRTQEASLSPDQTNHHAQSQAASVYEQRREQRIKENMERMQKLGILDLSSKLISSQRPPKRSYTKKPQTQTPQVADPPCQTSLPPRRSSRLQNAAPVSYVEKRGEKKENKEELRSLVGEGYMPEIYTEEDEKLLGNCEGTWVLFVDGCGKDGKRVYDPINGKTCHQCRQKTLGHRTHCCKCQLVQGQFCGDCLYMRYGENVLEVNQNPNWICPVCRGICNCSVCRQAKGWPATGTLYRRITKLGFKSVAHYLIQTRRAETNLGDAVTDDTVPVKGSLDFADTREVTEQKEAFVSEGQHESPMLGSEDNRSDELEGKKEESADSFGVYDVRNVKEELTNEHVDHGIEEHGFMGKLDGELEGIKVEPLNLAGMHYAKIFKEEHRNVKDGLTNEHAGHGIEEHGFIDKLDGEVEGNKVEPLNLAGMHYAKNFKEEHGNLKDEFTNKKEDELEGKKVELLNVRNFEEEHGNLKDGFIIKKDEELSNLDGVYDVKNVKYEPMNGYDGIVVVSPVSPENPEGKCGKLRPGHKFNEPVSDKSEAEVVEIYELMNEKKRNAKSVLNGPTSDSISGRLKQRRRAT